jgi:hypothetical protein
MNGKANKGKSNMFSIEWRQLLYFYPKAPLMCHRLLSVLYGITTQNICTGKVLFLTCLGLSLSVALAVQDGRHIVFHDSLS